MILHVHQIMVWNSKIQIGKFPIKWKEIQNLENRGKKLAQVVFIVFISWSVSTCDKKHVYCLNKISEYCLKQKRNFGKLAILKTMLLLLCSWKSVPGKLFKKFCLATVTGNYSDFKCLIKYSWLYLWKKFFDFWKWVRLRWNMYIVYVYWNYRVKFLVYIRNISKMKTNCKINPK